METALQQRLVGAIVLVALGVIFIPPLLDGSGYKSRHARSVEIPPPPAFAPPARDRVKPIATPLDETFEQVKQQAKAKAKAKASDKPGNEKAWALQVASFSKREKADQYRDELREQGYTVQVVVGAGQEKARYKVRIGPDLNRQKLEELKQKFEKQGDSKPFIVPHG